MNIGVDLRIRVHIIAEDLFQCPRVVSTYWSNAYILFRCKDMI